MKGYLMMKSFWRMKSIWLQAAFTVLVLAATTVSGGTIIYSGSNITENFDSLVAGSGTFSATVGVQSDIPGSTGFEGTKIAGTGTGTTNFTVGTGSSNTAGLYSFGNDGSTDRALGALASGTNIMGFGFRLVNNSANIVDSITVSFTQENWRSSTTNLNTIAAQFSFDQSLSAATFLTSTSGFTATTALSLVGPTPVASNSALNGNNAVNQVARTFTFSGLNWTNGQQFFLRWQDVNETGNDAGLAIDNMSINFTVAAVPEPSTVCIWTLAIGLVGLVRRRN
jgi:PEP-CTERM motif